MTTDIVIVGAGIAGLSCARDLSLAGKSPVVLERSRGVGGRCATRRIEDQPVDHGTTFLHGTDPDFLADLWGAEATSRPLEWPTRVEGHGTPCQPDVFSNRETCVAYAEGVTAFPKHLARGIDVRLGANVVSVEPSGDRFHVRSEDGREWDASTVVVALAVEQSLRLVEPLAELSAEIAAARALLHMVGSVPSLALIAGYPPDVDLPPWDICYPEDSRILQLVSHDSAKRPDRKFTVLVAQARPSWSGQQMDRPEESWAASILEEVGGIVGSWATRPLWTRPHTWKYARVAQENTLSRPLLMRLESGPTLALAGELFAWGGGVESAWMSGRSLARRLGE